MDTDLVTLKVIGGKKIYIVENHHEVLLPWSEYAIGYEDTPVLLTFDHHADTRTAFYKHASEAAGQEWKTESARLIQGVDSRDPNSVMAALEKLRNNEHIDFALKAGILSESVVFSLLNVGVCRDYANPDIYYIDPQDQIDVYDKVIEAQELQHKLKLVNRFIPGFFDSAGFHRNYILDIDLDCFHTHKAINPTDLTVFNDLVKYAQIITIATEPNYVELEKLEEDLNAKDLLSMLLMHIQKATESQTQL